MMKEGKKRKKLNWRRRKKTSDQNEKGGRKK